MQQISHELATYIHTTSIALPYHYLTTYDFYMGFVRFFIAFLSPFFPAYFAICVFFCNFVVFSKNIVI